MNSNFIRMLQNQIRLICGNVEDPCYQELFGSQLSSSSPQCNRPVYSQDMHSEMGMYANRLAEAEQRQRAMSTPDLGSEDEHSLIAQYCSSLHGNDRSHTLRSPMQIVMAMDVDQRTELQAMIYDLEEENRILQTEYDLLKQSRGSCDDPSTVTRAVDFDGTANHVSALDELDVDASRDVEMLAEAKLLRQHKGRLESRMRVLEEHNEQLEWQLSRLRQLVNQPAANGQIVTYPKSASLSDSRARYLSSLPGHGSLQRNGPPSFNSVMYGSLQPEPENGGNVDSLFQVAGEVDKAFGTLVNIITDDENSEDESDPQTQSLRH